MPQEIAIPIPKTFFNLDSQLYDGVWNIWFKIDEGTNPERLPALNSEMSIPFSDKKITVQRSILDVTKRMYGIQVRIEPKTTGVTTESNITGRAIFLALLGVLAITGIYLTFDKIERVLDESESTFAIWGLAALVLFVFLIIRALKK